MKRNTKNLIDGYLNVDRELLQFYLTLSKDDKVPGDLKNMWDELAEDETSHIQYFKYLIEKDFSLYAGENNFKDFSQALKYLKNDISRYSEEFKEGAVTYMGAFKKTVSAELKVLVSPLQEIIHTHDIILKEAVFNPRENYELHLQRIVDRAYNFFDEDSVEYNLVDSFQKIRKNQERVVREIKTDKLTGVKSRNYLFENGKFLLEISRRQKNPAGIIIMDVDKFKKINDSYGHFFGDKILKKIGRCLTKSIRSSDIAARYGGDEFVLILYDQSEKDVKEVIKRIKEEISSITVKVPRKNLSIVPRISAGYVIYDSYEDSPEIKKLINEADRMMYKKKNQKETY
ncbi:MAG: GGDEF domain-containing protein [Elusimicrobiota bacterium]